MDVKIKHKCGLCNAVFVSKNMLCGYVLQITQRYYIWSYYLIWYEHRQETLLLPPINQLVHNFGLVWNSSTTAEQIAMTFCKDIHIPQRMKPTDFDDPLSFLPLPPASKLLLKVFQWNMSTSTRLIVRKLCTGIHGSQECYHVICIWMHMIHRSLHLSFIVISILLAHCDQISICYKKQRHRKV